MLPRKETRFSRRWFSLTSVRGRQIVVWLALADLLASLGVLMRSVVKLNDLTSDPDSKNESMVFCTILAAWIQYFYVVTWAWTLCYAIDTWLALQRKPGRPMLYHSLAWSIPAVLTSGGLALLYIPNADCHNYSTDTMDTSDTYLRLLPNFLLTYLSISAVMILCPYFYFTSMKRVDEVVTTCLGQVTNKERSVVQTVKVRFGLINLTFYVCWLPNLINGLVVWLNWYNLPKTFLIVLWYFMAVLNPLQALFNSIVYRRSDMKIFYPFSSKPIDENTPLVPANVNL